VRPTSVRLREEVRAHLLAETACWIAGIIRSVAAAWQGPAIRATADPSRVSRVSVRAAVPRDALAVPVPSTSRAASSGTSSRLPYSMSSTTQIRPTSAAGAPRPFRLGSGAVRRDKTPECNTEKALQWN
jgi:hypothetical protein